MNSISKNFMKNLCSKRFSQICSLKRQKKKKHQKLTLLHWMDLRDVNSSVKIKMRMLRKTYCKMWWVFSLAAEIEISQNNQVQKSQHLLPQMILIITYLSVLCQTHCPSAFIFACFSSPYIHSPSLCSYQKFCSHIVSC